MLSIEYLLYANDYELWYDPTVQIEPEQDWMSCKIAAIHSPVHESLPLTPSSHPCETVILLCAEWWSYSKTCFWILPNPSRFLLLLCFLVHIGPCSSAHTPGINASISDPAQLNIHQIFPLNDTSIKSPRKKLTKWITRISSNSKHFS